MHLVVVNAHRSLLKMLKMILAFFLVNIITYAEVHGQEDPAAVRYLQECSNYPANNGQQYVKNNPTMCVQYRCTVTERLTQDAMVQRKASLKTMLCPEIETMSPCRISEANMQIPFPGCCPRVVCSGPQNRFPPGVIYPIAPAPPFGIPGPILVIPLGRAQESRRLPSSNSDDY